MFDNRVYETRAYKYCKRVATGKVPSNKWMILFAKKFINDIERSKDDNFPYFFDVQKAFFIEDFIIPNDLKVWGVIIILGIFWTAFCYIIQIYALKNTSAVQAGVILSLEPVFSAIFAFIFLGELLSKQGYVGALLLFISVLLAG